MGSKGDLLRTLAAGCGRKAGYARRSQFCSELAEREGFEPSVPREEDNGFRDRPVRPLRHLSG